jgi:hypothetical protein
LVSPNLLRHTVATLAYRGGKAVRGAPASFGAFRAAPGSRSAAEILAHICDLLDWGISLLRGQEAWHNVPPAQWDADVGRFFASLARFDALLASRTTAPACSPEQLFQGPIADALTHVGQLMMLRRLAGSSVKGENYLRAEIVAGRVGPEQPAPAYEFD